MSERSEQTAAALNVLVLGMHRSGTSAVAEALRAAGLNAGDDRGLMAPESQNPAGFGERLEIAHFNDRLLADLGWSWDAPGPTPLDEPPARPEFVSQGRELVRRELGGERPFVLKDPRISVLLPWWRQILLDRFVPVVVFRDPAEVAWSLVVRNKFSVQLGLTVYAAYYRHIFGGLSGMATIGVDFGALCDRPEQLIGQLLDNLASAGIEGSFDATAAQEKINPSLRRATQPPDLSAALADVPALADIREMWPAAGVAVGRYQSVIAQPTAWERAILDVQRSSRAAERLASEDHTTVALLGATSTSLQTRLDLVVDERDAARQLAREKQGNYEAMNRQLTSANARIEAVVAERARLETDLGRRLADTTRERDLLTLRFAELEVQHASLRQASAQLAATNIELQRELARRSRLTSRLSPRSLGVGMRSVYRRAIVRLPASFLGYIWHNPLFDRDWYGAQNPDLTRSGRQLEIHFRRHGSAEGRLPNRMFDPGWYLAEYPDVAASGMNPLDHYLLRGANEGRAAGPDFDTDWYLATNPDVVASRMNPLEHYLRFGRLEGRTARPIEPGQRSAKGSPVRAPDAAENRVGVRQRRRTSARPVVRLGGPALYPIRSERPSGNGRIRPATAISRPSEEQTATLSTDVRLIAFYQADPNWSAVAKATPQVASPHQPHVPSDLGFYDLRLAETRTAQAKLASDHGIYGFCYDASLDDASATESLRELIASGAPNLPFTVRIKVPPGVDGLDARSAHVDSVLGLLREDRAIRISGAKMLVVGGLSPSPDPMAAELIRDRARSMGLGDVFLVACAPAGETGFAASSVGADVMLDMQPDASIGEAKDNFRVARYDDYARAVRSVAAGSKNYELVLVGRDDAPMGAGVILTGPTAQAYREWLRSAITSVRDRFAADQRLVFVASWNDWPHGAHLEPDIRDGHAFLDATRGSLAAPALPTATR